MSAWGRETGGVDRRCLRAISEGREEWNGVYIVVGAWERERERAIRGGESREGREPACHCEIVGWKTRVNCSSSLHCAEWWPGDRTGGGGLTSMELHSPKKSWINSTTQHCSKDKTHTEKHRQKDTREKSKVLSGVFMCFCVFGNVTTVLSCML